MGFGTTIRNYGALRWGVTVATHVVASVGLGAAYAQSTVPAWDLVQTISHVETGNAAYSASRAAFRAAQQAVPEAMAPLLPRISLNGKLQSGSTLVAESTGAKDFHTNGYTLSLTQPIVNIGQWQAVGDAKLGEARDAVSLEETRQNLIAETTTDYIDVLAAQAKQSAADVHRAALAGALDAARHALASGTATVVDVEDAQARLARADADLIAVANDIEMAMNKLRRMAGDDSIVIKPLLPGRPIRPVSPGGLSDLLERAEAENVSVAKSRLEVRIAGTKIKEAASEFLPTAELVMSHSRGSATYLESQTNILLGRQGHSSAIGIQISVPIFDGFGTIAKTRQRLDEKESANNRLIETIRDVREQTREEYLTLVSSLSRMHALADAVQAATTALDETSQAFMLGVKVNVDVLDAEDRLYASRTDAIKATFDALKSDVNLRRLTNDLSEYYVTALNREIYGDSP